MKPSPVPTISVYPSAKGRDPKTKLWGHDDASAKSLRNLGWINGVPLAQIGKLIDECTGAGVAIVIRTDFLISPSDQLLSGIDQTV